VWNTCRHLTFLAVLLSACQGLVSDPMGSDRPDPVDPDDPIDPDAPVPDGATAAPFRRLSNDELANAIETLTGARPPSLSTLPGDVADGRTLFFPGIAGRQPLARIETLVAIADEAAVSMSDAAIAAYAPSCESSADRACAEEFAAELGLMAFRRAASADELASMLALYDDAAEHGDGIRQIVRFALLSASFLYVIENGAPSTEHPELAVLDSTELASRLALALTDDLPDRELLAAGRAGELATAETLRTHAERLFQTEDARHTVERFFDYWLGLEEVRSLDRDPEAFPNFDATLNEAMIAETHAFLAHETWEADAPLADLFRADFSFVDTRLGEFYGLEVASATPTRVMLPPERRGLLTQAAILSHEQGSTFTRPIQRSVYLLRRLLCVDIPPPPEDVDATPRGSEPGATTRETYDRLTAAGSCAGCHQTLINPPGFAFEDFDAVGAFRTTERGQPVDASGAIPSLGVEALSGGASVGLAVSELDQIHTCFARQWLRFALSRPETQADATSLRVIVTASREGRPLREVMLSLVDTFAFRHRAIPAE
jgi:hypothetical protein